MNHQYSQAFGQCHSLLLQRCAGRKAGQNGCLCQNFQSFKTCFNSLHSHQVALYEGRYKPFAYSESFDVHRVDVQTTAEQQTLHQQPAKAADPPLDPELAEFQAEIGAIEAETADANRAETPPPDQQRFQDDDGTSYAWDTNLRRFVPAGDELPSASYDPADMVYEAEDEKIPAMPSVLPVNMPYDAL